MAQQTAVEFLEKICKDRGYHLMEEYFEQAKQMEADQSDRDYNQGFSDGYSEGYDKGMSDYNKF